MSADVKLYTKHGLDSLRLSVGNGNDGFVSINVRTWKRLLETARLGLDRAAVERGGRRRLSTDATPWLVRVEGPATEREAEAATLAEAAELVGLGERGGRETPDTLHAAIMPKLWDAIEGVFGARPRWLNPGKAGRIRTPEYAKIDDAVLAAIEEDRATRSGQRSPNGDTDG